ncbi:MAG: helix-turn-helix domain-containing protein [Proteobacteria bacterium]|nr:helix-turn-helix domain-containing protein [Pseudomonadota bacterium]
MADNSIPGPMSMVKVDGSKIKHLREGQGLTQLYLATAVQVTTDTISRWENKRYPSIKKENGIKLAEALNVQLEDLLEENEVEEPLPLPRLAPSAIDLALTTDNKKSRIRNIWPFIILSLTLFCILAAFAWYFLYSSPDLPITAERNAPDHCIAGQPFPVMIKITRAPEDRQTAIIIRENLPANATVVKISPEAVSGGMKKDTISWLKKINESATFAYVIRVAGGKDDKVTFSGTAAISGDSDSPPPIGGSSKTTIDKYHWADVDMDNIISDSEILAVHDRYNQIEGIDVDIDAIEEIWLGSGYKWNETTKKIEIIE